MKIKRMLPPAAAPLRPNDLWRGFLGLFSGAKPVRRLESEIGEYFGTRHLFGVSSGKAALTVILLALKSLSPRRKVIVPAYTCFSVPAAVLKAELDLVPCDIDPATLDFDYGLLEASIDENTLCVVSTHLLGLAADLDRVRGLCRERGIYLVEDAAQAMGAEYRGKKIGAVGDVGFFSFGRGKNITCGSGGMIVTNSDRLAEAIGRAHARLPASGFFQSAGTLLEMTLMALFIRPPFYWFPAGLPFLKLGQTFFHREFPMERLSGLKAALLRNWKRRLEESNRARRENGACFRKRLRLKTPGGDGEATTYLRFPVLMSDRSERDALYRLLDAEGMGAGCMYPTPINEIDEIKGMFEGMRFPGAKEAAETLLTLPTHPFVSEKDRARISDLIDQAQAAGAVAGRRSDSLRLQCG